MHYFGPDGIRNGRGRNVANIYSVLFTLVLASTVLGVPAPAQALRDPQPDFAAPLDAVPRIGFEVEFTRLHPADRGDLDRAIEVAIIKSCRKGGAIEIEHQAGATKLILRSAGQARVLGDIRL
jgi:hypothetical protein